MDILQDPSHADRAMVARVLVPVVRPGLNIYQALHSPTRER